jgi:hypothetical protein
VITMKEAGTEFLSHKRVGVTGVSRTPGSHGSNVVYKRLHRGPGTGSVSELPVHVRADRRFVGVKRLERAQVALKYCLSLFTVAAPS